MDLDRLRRRIFRPQLAAACALTALLMIMPATGMAETITPDPSATGTASGTPPESSGSPSATDSGTGNAAATSAETAGTTSASPETSPTLSPTSTKPTASVSRADAESESPLTLSVSTIGSPQPGTYFQDIGAFGVTGHAADASTPVEIWRYGGGTWSKLGSAQPDDAGDFSARYPVLDVGTYLFQATSGGAPAGATVVSNQVSVTVVQSSIALDAPVAKIDSLKNPKISGHIVPARRGIAIHIDVRISGYFRYKAAATTDQYGRFSASLSYGNGSLATYTIRATYHATNRDRWEISNWRQFSRIAVLNAVSTATTSADVAKTYHSGCPVGPSKLRTIRMNFYGFDHKMHRGVMIVRSDLVSKITRGFGSALTHRFPIAKMNNPNVYGGNDPVQMEADNSSAFNCRKVVGNPYRMSPHSYGIAIDVNTVQNPYRDVNGKWWPDNGKPYIKRSPRRAGMLFSDSYLTKSLRADQFFWGGFWSPGHDYQHFQYSP
jgi:hypothetical protein